MPTRIVNFVLPAGILAVLLMYASPDLYAGDELDYSAPYVTVENGELVTKYPAREHASAEALPQATLSEVATPPEQETDMPLRWSIVLAGIISIMYLLRRDRRKQQVQNPGSTG